MTTRPFRTATLLMSLVLFLPSLPLFADEVEEGVIQPATEETEIWGEVKELYRKAKESGEKVPGDVSEWVKKDFGKIGSWEYRVVTLGTSVAAEVETELNKMGDERWECYVVLPGKRGVQLYLKRKQRSWLQAIPVGDLFRLIGGVGDDGVPEP